MSLNDNKKLGSSRRDFLQQMTFLSLATLITPHSAKAIGGDVVDKNSLRVLCCNIRVDLPEDEKTGHGWKSRREACLEIIKKQKSDVIGFQEVLSNQFHDLKRGLTDYFGIGFDGPEMDRYKDGYHGIAKNPIFFSKKRFELLTAGGYWLSENPLEAGSISWDSARARNAFWIRLLDKKTGKEVRVINFHLDHVKEEAKIQQVLMVLKESAQYQQDFIQIMTGDFNSHPDSKVISNVLEYGWVDSFTGKLEGTGHGFKPHDMERAARAKKIDFIFSKGSIQAKNSRILKDSFNGIYPSDHYFLVADFEFRS